MHWVAGDSPAIVGIYKTLSLGTLAAVSVYLRKGKDDMAFIALIKTWVKSSRFILK